MKYVLLSVVFFLAGASSSLALEPPPATAKKASIEELKGIADGKPVSVVIFDEAVPITADLVWNWKKKTITGTALVNSKDKIKVAAKLSFKGDQACSTSGKDKPSCHTIFIDGNKFYEIRDDGKVHAVSTVK